MKPGYWIGIMAALGAIVGYAVVRAADLSNSFTVVGLVVGIAVGVANSQGAERRVVLVLRGEAAEPLQG